MTPPSTSKTDDLDRQQNRLQIIVVGIVSPILIAFAILGGLGIIELPTFSDENEKFRFEKIGTHPEQLLPPNKVFMSTNFFNLGLTLDEEIALVEHIFAEVEDLECMNVNWYGIHEKKQIFYNESVGEIQSVIYELGLRDSMVDTPSFLYFIQSPIVQTYIETYCNHVWAIDKIPENYDPNAGMSPYISCLEHPFFLDKDYCFLLKSKKPLQT